MSIAVLVQVYDEVRRLAIAGSGVAAGDFRLKKLIPALEKAGEKAPVFAKVAQAAAAVVDCNDKTASTALLELTALVSAILYTQGETGIAGNFAPLETTDLGVPIAQASARVIKPLLDALSSTGSGRMELVRDAFERGTFNDFRLVKPALHAIDDPHPEIGQFIADKVLPLYGKAILPELRAKLDIKGRGGHVRRFQLMNRLDPQGSRPLVQSVLNVGSQEMRVAAVECLGTADDDLAYLLDQSRSKAKDVRAAALRALAVAGVSRPDIIAALKKAISGTDLELFMHRANECALAEIQEFILEQALQQVKDLLSSKDKKEQGKAVVRLQQLICCVEERTDAKAEAFLLKCFHDTAAFAAIKSEPSGADLNDLVASVLAQGTPKMQQQLFAAQKTLTGGMLSPALFAGRAVMEPAEFYNEFSPILKGLSEKRGKKNSVDHDRARALLSALMVNNEHFPHRSGMVGPRFLMRKSDAPLRELDPRWLDTAADAGSLELVCHLARAGNAHCNRFLAEQLNVRKEPYESQLLLQTMVRVGHPDAADMLVDALRKQSKIASYYYNMYGWGRMIEELPRSALPKLEELLATLPEKMVDQLMDSVLVLKNKQE
jgi:hypothetical protein